VTLALLVPGVGMGGGLFVAPFRGTLGTAGFEYMLIYPDTVILPGDVITPDGILGGRGSRISPGSGTRGNTGSAGAGSGRS
jgi:hypothetical protein